MVASISARGGVQATLGYYGHLGQDDYYLRGHEPPGRWAGEGAARLSLDGPVIRSEFEAVLKGIDPKTGARLTAVGGHHQNHAAGWDVTFSAPKSVSVLWALSDADRRQPIEQAQRVAVATATKHLEQTAAFARRGKGGTIREPAAGLTLAKFDHHTSRDLDPQLHTHVFVFNVAARKDGTWGAIVSRELYKAQKQAGAIYRDALATELERHGYGIERAGNNFRVAAIPRAVERAFSKRRESIEAAAAAHCYHTPKGMEHAALRTRQAKRAMPREYLFAAWKAEARAMGFVLRQTRTLGRVALPNEVNTPASTSMMNTFASVERAVGQLGAAARAIDANSVMPGVAVSLSAREHRARLTLDRDR